MTNKQPKQKRHPLFSQNYIFSQTATDTPPPKILPVINVHLKNEEKTKIRRKKETKVKGKVAVPSKAKTQSNSSSRTLDTSNSTATKQKQQSRKSSIDFIKSSEVPKKRKKRIPTPNEIVCTSCDKKDQDLLRQLISKFGKFKLAKNVTRVTSHIISGDGRRTINKLKGIMVGCWILSTDWLLASLEAGFWVDEESYEMTDFSDAVRYCR